jgi:cobalamin transport system ATP-binding protein
MIELRDLTIGYRRRRRTTTVAAGLHAVARRGELTVLLGPNGCGKSTLIRTLCGLQPAIGGQVLLDGNDLARVAADKLARHVAVVLTDRIDPGLLSARELAGLGRIPHLGLAARLTADDNAVVDWALTAVNAGHLASRPAAELSDGERQRVLTARALAQQPSVLLLDEPTAFLDVPSRTGLMEVLHGLARKQDLALVLSTHDLELALRVADRVWLFDAAGALQDAIPEELILDGQIGSVFDCATTRFDPADGVFVLRHDNGRAARVDAPTPLRGAVQRTLAREGWAAREPAEIIVAATEPARITVRAGGQAAASTTLSDLPRLLRALPASTLRCVPEAATTKLMTELCGIGGYFAVGVGAVDHGWRPVGQLYTDIALLDGIISRVQARMDATEQRVAASTFFLGFAARLWSIGLGALAGHRLLLDLDAEYLLFREQDGQIRLHIEHPVAWHGDDLEQLLADMVLAEHLSPLTAALRRLGPISGKVLRGNAASALLGAARVFDRDASGSGWQLARQLCSDERLAAAICFNEATYRRSSCCLYYRAPRGGLCGDCVLTSMPWQRRKVTP